MLAKTGVHYYSGDNVSLGTACGKYFRVSTLSIIDPGDSDIIRSAPTESKDWINTIIIIMGCGFYIYYCPSPYGVGGVYEWLFEIAKRRTWWSSASVLVSLASMLRKTKQPGGDIAGDWSTTGTFLRKPAGGWLHEDRELKNGLCVNYSVQVQY